jgi:ADP-L-glycero-D-manno-heptose 6-epimerase
MASRPLHVVTGGAGFIGSNIAAKLQEQGADVCVVDVLGSDEKWRNIAKRRLIDIVDPAQTVGALEAWGPRVTSVIHMGAVSSTTERNVDVIVESNFRYSCRLWNWCADNNIPFVYASSAATYGDGSSGFDDRTDSEYLARLRPLSAYAWSKHLFDCWVCDRVASCEQRAPSRWAGLKFFNVYGPNEYHKGPMRSVAVQVFEQIQRGEPVKLFASDRPEFPDGGQNRDFVWVGDCVDIALWFVSGVRQNGIYNVGSGKARSFSDLAGAVFATTGKSPRIEFVQMPEKLKGKYQYFTEAPMEKLSVAGYTGHRTALEVGVEKYVMDYLLTSDIHR